MKRIFTQLWTMALLLVSTSLYAQTPAWQWGRSGGAASSSGPNGEDNVIDMATDPNGNVYVLANNNEGTGIKIDGQSVGISPFDQVSIAKWNCKGDLKWVKVFGGGVNVVARALGVDTLGGVYITGFVLNGNNVPGPEGYSYFDTDTTLPVTNKSMYLIKYDTSGAFQWLKMPQSDTVSIGSVGHSQFADMSVSPSGDIYAFCFLSPGAYNGGSYIVTTQSNHILKYNRFGTFLGGTEMDIHTSAGSGGGGDLVNVQRARFSRDSHSGRYYFAGYYDSDFGTLSFGNTTFPDTAKFYLAAFDNGGNSLWTKMNTGGSGLNGITSRPVIDELGNVYVCGNSGAPMAFNGYAFNSNFAYGVPFIIANDSNGNLLWGTNGQNENSSYGANAIVYNNNTLGVTGSYGGKLHWDSFMVNSPINIINVFFARINATTGQVIGLDSIASNSIRAYPTSIVSDKNNNFYVGGQFGNELYVAGDTLSKWGGEADWFVAKFGSANCNCTIPQPSFNYNSTGNNTYAFNYTGSTPYTGISWDFGDGTPVSTMNNPTHSYATSGTYHVCVTVTNDCGSNTNCRTINADGLGLASIPGFADIHIYPNPATQEIVIDNATAGMTIEIYNVTGQLLLHTVLKGNKDKVNVSALPSGVYLMRFTDKEGRQGNSKFVKQ